MSRLAVALFGWRPFLCKPCNTHVCCVLSYGACMLITIYVCCVLSYGVCMSITIYNIRVLCTQLWRVHVDHNICVLCTQLWRVHVNHNARVLCTQLWRVHVDHNARVLCTQLWRVHVDHNVCIQWRHPFAHWKYATRLHFLSINSTLRCWNSNSTWNATACNEEDRNYTKDHSIKQWQRDHITQAQKLTSHKHRKVLSVCLCVLVARSTATNSTPFKFNRSWA